MVWKIWKTNKSNSEMIWAIWKNDKLNSENNTKNMEEIQVEQ